MRQNSALNEKWVWVGRSLIMTAFFTLITGLTVIQCLADNSGSSNYQDKAFNVGLRIVDFEYAHLDGAKEIVTAAMWYPTKRRNRPFTYHCERDFRSRVAVNVPIAQVEGPYPLIVFAHGGFGSGYNSAYFMEYLASRGYIAIGPDFIDTKPPDFEEPVAFSTIRGGKGDPAYYVLAIAREFVDYMERERDFFLSYMEEHRLDHTTFLIDQMTALNKNMGSDFFRTIDEDMIGMCGHSEGGLTVLGKVGAHPAPRFQDDRIKAALVFSAPVYPFEDTLGYVSVPIMVMVGDHDPPPLHPELPRRMVFDDANPPRFYLVLRNATHFAFANGACRLAPLYIAAENNSRINAICRYGLAFFEKYLKGNVSPNEQLGKTDPAWVYYIKEEKAGEVFEWGKEPRNWILGREELNSAN